MSDEVSGIDKGIAAASVPLAKSPNGPTPTSPELGSSVPKSIVAAAFIYLILLLALFSLFVTWKEFRLDLPSQLGPLPIGVVWFGAVGAVVSSFRGIFAHNQSWDPSYNLWHYSRPILGATTGSIGALMYWVVLTLGSTTTVTVRPTTFFVASFVLGFADKAFGNLLNSVTNLIINPGNSHS
jgi:hypothetical protein